MSTIVLDVSGLSGTVQVELPVGSTAADLREAADINEGLSLRSEGRSLSDDEPLRDGQTVVSTAPAAKHGAASA